MNIVLFINSVLVNFLVVIYIGIILWGVGGCGIINGVDSCLGGLVGFLGIF